MISNMVQGQDRFRYVDEEGYNTTIVPNGTRSVFVINEFNIENGDNN